MSSTRLVLNVDETTMASIDYLLPRHANADEMVRCSVVMYHNVKFAIDRGCQVIVRAPDGSEAPLALPTRDPMSVRLNAMVAGFLRKVGRYR